MLAYSIEYDGTDWQAWRYNASRLFIAYQYNVLDIGEAWDDWHGC